VPSGGYWFSYRRTDGLRDGEGRTERGELQHDLEQVHDLRTRRNRKDDLLSDAVL
jgi:hypothetical protein